MSSLRTYSLVSIVTALISQYLWSYLSTTEYCYTQITTLSDTQPLANCFTVSRSGHFKSVYTKTNAASSQQGYVLPGLWDGHGHILQYGEMVHSADLFQSQSLDETLARIANYQATHPDEGTADSWLRGMGWDQAAFGGVMPTAADLERDPRLQGKYIMLDRVDVHCIWVSQAVLDLLPNPLPDHVDGGEIVREPGLGVFCDNAMDLITDSVFPEASKAKKAQWLADAMSKLNSVGIVGVHDAGVQPENLELYAERASNKDWTVRVYAMLACSVRNSFCPQSAKKVSMSNGMLSVRSVKLFADGALGSWGSALLEPYDDRPGEKGSLLVNASTLTSLAVSWAQLGYQVNIHAIGDLANRNAVNALTAALEAICPGKDADLKACQEKARFRIEHSQIIHPDDQVRMHNLGIIPSIQPTHATSDMEYAEDRLGKQRIKTEAYRMRSFLDLQPILGSDFPVEPPPPFEGIFAAVTRRSPRTGQGRGGEDKGWYENESLTVEEALLGFTRNVARGAFLEGKVGVIHEGAFADWIVVDRDVLRIPADELRQDIVKETWVGGRRVFQQK